MDIDAYAAAHRDQWERLDALVAKRRLSGAEADELVTLYRATAGHLSHIRTGAPDPRVLAEMSARVAAARARLTGTREAKLSDLRRFWAVIVPAALYRVRWWTTGVTIASLALAVVVAVWTLRSPDAMSALGTRSELDRYAHDAFESYYSTYAPQDFASLVWTNNARIAVLCVAGGITGLLPAVVLVSNALNLGQAAAIMTDHGMLAQFLMLTSPHGLLELTCVFAAGGAGLRLFWTLLVPGPRPRSEALAEEGRTLITAALGLAVFLALSGIIEAFVTPAPIPWAAKLAIGALALALLWAYTLVLGRRAVSAGATGDLVAEESGELVPVAG